MDDELKVKLTSLYDQALIECDKAKPSSDPKYWAKRSHNACLGRGTITMITKLADGNTMKYDAICDCSSRRWVRWKDKWIADYIEKHKSESK